MPDHWLHNCFILLLTFLLYFSMDNRDFSVKIETDNLTVSDMEIITLDFTVSKKKKKKKQQ